MGKLVIKSKAHGTHAVLYDDEDEHIIKAYTWRILWGKTQKQPCVTGRKKGASNKSIYVHRAIMNPPDDLFVDHINLNRLDNRRCNLRIATKAQNNRNVSLRKDNTSGYKGISLNKRAIKNPWEVSIAVMGKNIHIGCYPTKEQAALAYNKAALKYHGEFARLNDVIL
jgi:hypothetical protein